MADLAALAAAIEAGDRATAKAITQAAVDEGMDPKSVLDAMTGAMEVIGTRFACNEIYVPEMLISARAMKEATAVLEPVLTAAGIRPEHTAVIGTIKGDLHDIGKNLVGDDVEGGQHRGRGPRHERQPRRPSWPPRRSTGHPSSGSPPS